MRMIVGLFDRFADAAGAVRALEGSGVERARISLVASRSQVTTLGDTPDGATDAADGAVTGAVVGGLTGLVTGLAAFAIPGVGPFLGTGVLAASFAGAGIGVVAGGVIGALTDAGVSEPEAHVYAEGIRRGGTLVAVSAAEGEVHRVTEILDRNGSINVRDRADLRRGPGATTPAINDDHQRSDTMSGSSHPGDEAGRLDRIDEKRERPRPEKAPAFAQPGDGAAAPDLSRGSPPPLGEFRAGVDVAAAPGMIDRPAVGEAHRTGVHIPNPGQEGLRGPHHLSSASQETTMVGSPELEDRAQYVDPADLDALQQVEPSRGGASPIATGEGPAACETARPNGAAGDRVESVRETSRKLDLGRGADWGSEFDRYEEDFRRDFQSRPGSDYTFDDAKVAYRHGCELACECNGGQEDWGSVESEARRRWEESHPTGTWPRVRDAAHYAYDRVRSKA